MASACHDKKLRLCCALVCRQFWHSLALDTPHEHVHCSTQTQLWSTSKCVQCVELRVHVIDYVTQYCDKTHGHRLRDARLHGTWHAQASSIRAIESCLLTRTWNASRSSVASGVPWPRHSRTGRWLRTLSYVTAPVCVSMHTHRHVHMYIYIYTYRYISVYMEIRPCRTCAHCNWIIELLAFLIAIDMAHMHYKSH